MAHRRTVACPQQPDPSSGAVLWELVVGASAMPDDWVDPLRFRRRGDLLVRPFTVFHDGVFRDLQRRTAKATIQQLQAEGVPFLWCASPATPRSRDSPAA